MKLSFVIVILILLGSCINAEQKAKYEREKRESEEAVESRRKEYRDQILRLKNDFNSESFFDFVGEFGATKYSYQIEEHFVDGPAAFAELGIWDISKSGDSYYFHCGDLVEDFLFILKAEKDILQKFENIGIERDEGQWSEVIFIFKIHSIKPAVEKALDSEGERILVENIDIVEATIIHVEAR